MFALVDCNNFYASCERVFQPQFNKVPVAILSNNDGCFISRSDEAKKVGLPMGAPAFKYKEFCKKHNIKIFSSNYPLYGDMSARVMNILKQFSPDLEVYSIDEAFLQFKGFKNYDFDAYGKRMQYKVEKSTGIPISIGIASTKAKWSKIETVWGIGSGNLKRLQTKNVKTAFDFTQLPDEWVKKNMAITGLRLKKDLEGIATIMLDDNHKNKKTIATTRSFESTFSDIENIKERISTFAGSCAEKLRVQQSSCTKVSVFLRSDRHKKDQIQDKSSAFVILPFASNSTLTISNSAIKAVESIYKEGVNYKKAGVIVSDLVATTGYQLNLFQKENPKHKLLMKTFDAVNTRWSGHKIKIGNQDLKRTWKMRQEHLSPKYTTDINDIIVVK